MGRFRFGEETNSFGPARLTESYQKNYADLFDQEITQNRIQTLKNEFNVPKNFFVYPELESLPLSQILQKYSIDEKEIEITPQTSRQDVRNSLAKALWSRDERLEKYLQKIKYQDWWKYYPKSSLKRHLFIIYPSYKIRQELVNSRLNKEEENSQLCRTYLTEILLNFENTFLYSRIFNGFCKRESSKRRGEIFRVQLVKPGEIVQTNNSQGKKINLSFVVDDFENQDIRKIMFSSSFIDKNYVLEDVIVHELHFQPKINSAITPNYSLYQNQILEQTKRSFAPKFDSQLSALLENELILLRKASFPFILTLDESSSKIMLNKLERTKLRTITFKRRFLQKGGLTMKSSSLDRLDLDLPSTLKLETKDDYKKMIEKKRFFLDNIF